MILDAIVMDGARCAYDVAASTGLRLPLIWAGVTALAEKGLVRVGMLRAGDLHASPAGVAAVRDRHAELDAHWFADAAPSPEPA